MKRYLVFWFYAFFIWSNSYGQQNEVINWLTWEDVQEAQKTEKRKVFVDVYTNWCGYCKKMDIGVFADSSIIDYVNTHYYAVKFNAETTDSILFLGRTYTYKTINAKKCNELANALLNGKMTYPTVVFLNENFKSITSISGYLDKRKLEPILVFFNEEYYKGTNWDIFNANFYK